jgi:hypothetical protein
MKKKKKRLVGSTVTQIPPSQVASNTLVSSHLAAPPERVLACIHQSAVSAKRGPSCLDPYTIHMRDKSVVVRFGCFTVCGDARSCQSLYVVRYLQGHAGVGLPGILWLLLCRMQM